MTTSASAADGIDYLMDAWYLILSKPRKERVALENLSRQGYKAYLPMLRTRRRRYGQYRSVVEPMFPRYLFVQLNDQTDNWGPIRSTIGVTTLVRFGDEPGRVPDDLVAALLENEHGQGFWELPEPEFRAGERVRIREGTMAGYEGIFQCKSGKERVIILLDIVNQTARTEIAAAHIESVGS